MAATKPRRKLSVMKRIRQTIKITVRNKAARSRMKTYIKKLNDAIKANDKDLVQKVLRETVKVISSSASSGILHRNTASRKISRLTKMANAVMISEAA